MQNFAIFFPFLCLYFVHFAYCCRIDGLENVGDYDCLWLGPRLPLEHNKLVFYSTRMKRLFSFELHKEKINPAEIDANQNIDFYYGDEVGGGSFFGALQNENGRRFFRGILDDPNDGVIVFEDPLALMNDTEHLKAGLPDTVIYVDGNRQRDDGEFRAEIIDYQTISINSNNIAKEPIKKMTPPIYIDGKCEVGFIVDWKAIAVHKTEALKKYWKGQLELWMQRALRHMNRLLRLNGIFKFQFVLKKIEFAESCVMTDAGPNMCNFERDFDSLSAKHRTVYLLGNFSMRSWDEFCQMVYLSYHPKMTATGAAYTANLYGHPDSGGLCARSFWFEDIHTSRSYNTMFVSVYPTEKSMKYRLFPRIARTVMHELSHAAGAHHETTVRAPGRRNLMHPKAYINPDDEALYNKDMAFIPELSFAARDNISAILNNRFDVAGCKYGK